VGFDSARAAYTYLILGIVFPAYYTTAGQAVAAMSPTAEVALLVFALFVFFMFIFNGVLQPYKALGWWKWMYRMSPFTYINGGLLGQALGRRLINCSPVEFVVINPPSGQTCGEYMDAFISFAGGYLNNPEDSTACRFCGVRSSDQFLADSFNIYYDHRWRDIGVLVAFTAFNIFCIFGLSYLCRFRKRR